MGCKRKKRNAKCVDHFSEFIKLGQLYHLKRWGQPISYEKVKGLYEIFLEQIMEAVNKNVRVTLTEFGSFGRAVVPGYKTELRGKEVYSSMRVKVYFRASQRFKKSALEEYKKQMGMIPNEEVEESGRQ